MALARWWRAAIVCDEDQRITVLHMIICFLIKSVNVNVSNSIVDGFLLMCKQNIVFRRKEHAALVFLVLTAASPAPAYEIVQQAALPFPPASCASSELTVFFRDAISLCRCWM